jgi:hypothetical protein
MKLSWIAVAILGVFAAGCKGTDDNAPTNTKNSQYIGGGKSAADQVGEARAHRRLPGGGKDTGQ